MAQHTNITQPRQRFTRTDFTALRARLASKLAAETIIRLYYNEDELTERGILDSSQMNRFLDGMRDELIARSIDANPLLAETLRNARRMGSWPRKVIDFLVSAADAMHFSPRPNDPVSAWFLPIIAKHLKADNIRSMADLMRCLQVRGANWFRPITGLGRGKAAKIVSWLHQHADTLGEIPHSVFQEDSINPDQLIVIGPGTERLAPLDRILVAASLDGRNGANRHPARPLIQAEHDLDVVKAFLYKHRENAKTYRAYQKELERFVLWCIKIRQKALSSIAVEDCEAYKDFLVAIPSDWLAPRRLRHTGDWRPFASQLSAKSRKYAITVIRGFFAWAIQVRYLSGNPWVAVADPKAEISLQPIQVDKALSENLWDKIAGENGILDQLCAMTAEELHRRYPMRGAASRFPVPAQWRTARDAILLIGQTGIRREEAAFATRDKLKPYPEIDGLHELAVLGKRAKWRDVFMPLRVVNALAAHWADRGEDFSFGMSPTFLLSPVIIPATELALGKHQPPSNGQGFSVEGIYTLIKTAFKRIADDMSLDLSADERRALASAGVHALRHTYGTNAVANEVPLDVIQQTLGHASLQTTTIYTQGKKRRKASELNQFFNKKKPPNGGLFE